VGGDVDSVAALALATVAALEGCQWGNNQTGWFRDV